MSWNVLLEPTLPPCFASCSQAQSPTVASAARRPRRERPKMPPVAAAPQVNPAPIPCISLAAIQKTPAPLTHADAVSLKSP